MISEVLQGSGNICHAFPSGKRSWHTDPCVYVLIMTLHIVFSIALQQKNRCCSHLAGARPISEAKSPSPTGTVIQFLKLKNSTGAMAQPLRGTGCSRRGPGFHS